MGFNNIISGMLLFACFILTTLLHSNLVLSESIPSPCKEEPEMPQRQDRAKVVVSGTVRQLMNDEIHSTNGHTMMKGVVEIKRVFKGQDMVDLVAKVKPGRLRPLKSVMIEGFGDPHICNNSVRERETKIFLLNPNGNGELKLNSSIVSLTLNNLDHVDAVVKNIPYSPPPPPEPVSPCYLHFCPFGATCRVNETSNTAVCMCEQTCSQVFAPVCGSDRATYTNPCMLERGSCVHRRKIRVKSQGECDPCQGFKCEAPKVCHVSADRQPECKCNYVCFEEANLVCGTDGRNYSNQCMLKMQACKSRKDIRVLYQGPCSPDNNPCSKVKCGPYQDCSVDRNGVAKCMCPQRCEPVLRRVCGNDSVTYDNICELKRQSCLNNNFVSLQHETACNSGSPCMKQICPYGGICKLVNNEAVCECPECSEELMEVCGTNGITYQNECKLKRDNCQYEKEIKVANRGRCDTCGQSHCEFYAICSTVQGKPTCVCPKSCVKVQDPVCGSDGKTYDNECELRVKSCEMKTFLTIASTGSCDKCRNIECKFSAKCKNGVCVCPLLCPTVRNPVCGSDGVSYINDCELKKKACANSIELEVASYGECDGDAEYFSGSGDGSGDFIIDGDDEDINIIPTKKPKKPCNDNNCVRFGGTCEMEGLDFTCSCDFKCNATRQPVCGSDGRLYGNRCMMRYNSCMKRQPITEDSMDNCDEFIEEEPCDGKTALVNPDTGSDYDCSPGKDECPAKSYCHISLDFSKCCHQETEVIHHCSETEFGCCPNGVTPSPSSRMYGCPGECRCHPVGSFQSTCNPKTKQCTCKPGVGGKRCDRCETGYWGMKLIELEESGGCIECNCNKIGSHRDDCDQMTGRCMCKPSVLGLKCDSCRKGSKLGPNGCTADEQSKPLSCADLNCQYGSTCREDGVPACICEYQCDVANYKPEVVCGSDGQNYGSQCQMEQYACRMKFDLRVLHTGHCKGAPPTLVTTPSPVTKSRKTTRHIGDNASGTDIDRLDNKNQKDENDDESEEEKQNTCTVANIGELCRSDSDCCPNNSVCKGLCYCDEGYISSLDNTKCFMVKKKSANNNSSATDVCSGDGLCASGSECLPDDYLGYRCACPVGKAGPRCNKDITFKTPSFSGRSHLELPHIEDASQNLRIDIVFSSLNQDGIVLFNAKFKNGTGDFVSITVKGGYVEFRYDLGGGPAILRSLTPIKPKSTHRVMASRSREKGELIVDNDEVVKGSSPATHTSLDLNDPMFLGFVPKVPPQIYQRLGVDLGLVGCIYSLTAGSTNNMYTYSLGSNARYPDIVRGVDITECGKNPCKSMPCQNGGTCLVLDAQIFECQCRDGYEGHYCEKLLNPCASDPCQYGGTCLVTSSPEGYFCQCPHGREGQRCEKELIPQLFVPQFTGDSYMQLPIEDQISNTLSITVWFKSLKPNGVILFATQSPGGRGDFISLNLRNKKVIFSFFLGSEVAKIQSAKHIHLDKWHEVTVTRTGNEGQMSIDGHTPVTGMAGDKGSSKVLNIGDRPMYVGGFNSTQDIPPRAGIENGLTGAIQRIIINGRTIDGLMASALTMNNISPYSGPPCHVNPCMNGGVCIPMLNRVECRCPTDFMGKNCEKHYDRVDKDQPLQFDGLTYLSYPNEVTQKQKGQKNNALSVILRTSESNGVILLQKGGDSVVDDYLTLAISNGYAEFSYNLGKQDPGNLHIIRSKVKVNDGDWHTISVERNKREGKVIVDGGEPVIASSLEGTQQLDTDGLLWVGGHSSLPWYLPTTRNFVGCIDSVEVNGVKVHLLEDTFDKSSSIAFCT